MAFSIRSLIASRAIQVRVPAWPYIGHILPWIKLLSIFAKSFATHFGQAKACNLMLWQNNRAFSAAIAIRAIHFGNVDSRQSSG
jgi:hypothetical protein